MKEHSTVQIQVQIQPNSQHHPKGKKCGVGQLLFSPTPLSTQASAIQIVASPAPTPTNVLMLSDFEKTKLANMLRDNG